MMCFVVAGVLALVAPQDNPAQDETAKKLEELTKRVEALEKERARLLEQIDRLERFGIESAETISKLKKQLQSGARQPAPSDPPPAGKEGSKAETGPLTPVHGKILTVVPDAGFMIVKLGEEDGVKEGWEFEVVRINKDQDGNPNTELLGKAVFEKFVAGSRSQSKLKITEGNPAKMKFGDSVVANRRMEALPPPKEGADKEAKPSEARKFKIVGMTGDTIFVNAGSLDNLKQSDKVYVYRDKRAIAQLRLDRVDKDNSSAKIIDGTKIAEPALNDEVSLKDLKTSIVGKVKRVETSGDATGAWIEVGQQQGVKMGMQFEVRRQGKTVGRIVVKSLQTWHSVCEAVAPMTLEDLKNDDFIESVE
jgi:hypothetical protein